MTDIDPAVIIEAMKAARRYNAMRFLMLTAPDNTTVIAIMQSSLEKKGFDIEVMPSTQERFDQMFDAMADILDQLVAEKMAEDKANA